MIVVSNRIARHAYNAYLRLLLAVNLPGLFRLLMVQEWYRNLLDKWISDLEIQACDTVLDAGCGPGLLTHRLSRICLFAVGADLSPRMLRMANAEFSRKEGNVSFVCTDISAGGFRDESFDCVLASSLINVVAEPATMVTVLRRTAKSGGVVSLLYPTPAMTKAAVMDFSSRHGLPMLASTLLATWQSKATKMDPKEVTALLSKQGLREVECAAYLDGMVVASSFQEPSVAPKCVQG